MEVERLLPCYHTHQQVIKMWNACWKEDIVEFRGGLENGLPCILQQVKGDCMGLINGTGYVHIWDGLRE